MAYIGEIGKRIKIVATYKTCFEYTDYKFSYYGTTHFIHVFEDEKGNSIVWKTTNMVETVNDGKENPNRKGDVVFISKGSKVEMVCTVKDHGEYKGNDQTIVTRCKFALLERAKTKAEIDAERAEEQEKSIGENDMVWEMPYRQFKEHYSDCETIIGSFNAHENSRGVRHAEPTIKVIIREGRLKNSGVRGKHYSGYEFTTNNGLKVVYRAVSEENARKQMAKEFKNSENWECTKIYNHRNKYTWF